LGPEISNTEKLRFSKSFAKHVTVPVVTRSEKVLETLTRAKAAQYIEGPAVAFKPQYPGGP